MDPVLGALITGLFGGAGATLLWELALSPTRDRRNIAEVLAAEISINMQLVAAAFVTADPKKIPPDFSLSTQVYLNLIDRIGLLPPDLIGEVVFLYRYFEELNRLPVAYVDFVNQLRDPANQSPERQRQLEGETQACINVFNSYLDKLINRLNLVQPRLLAVAFPWWSIRRWRRQPSQLLELSDVEKRRLNALAHRAELALGIRRSKQGS